VRSLKRWVVALIWLSCLAYFADMAFFFPHRWQKSLVYGNGPEIGVYLKPHMTATDFAREVKRCKVVDDADSLARWLRRLDVDRRLTPGLYRLRRGSPWEVAHEIAEAEPELLNVAIVPGEDPERFLQRLKKICSFPDPEAKMQEALLRDENFPPALRPFLCQDWRNRMAFLAPETYRVTPSPEGLEELVKGASSAWWESVSERVRDKLDQLFDIAVLAAIVEKESALSEERRRIAGVFMNRLKAGMPLQSCATVIFAWRLNGESKTTLTHDDLRLSSPYNTYLHQGLPPGIIAIPSIDSWSAVLEPEEHSYYYFVLKSDGEHHFSRTYQEHLKAQKEEGRNQSHK